MSYTVEDTTDSSFAGGKLYTEADKDQAYLDGLKQGADVAYEQAEADLQEKLRQQREACLAAISGKVSFTMADEILNAEIDNNREEG